MDDLNTENEDVNMLMHKALDLTKQRKAKKSISINQYAASIQVLEQTSTQNLMKLKKQLNEVIN